MDLLDEISKVLYFTDVKNDTYRLLRQILKSGKVTEGQLDSLLGELGLSATKLLTLRYLNAATEPVALGVLAHTMAFAKSNATQLIDHLESSGLARRVPSRDDRRCTRVATTGKGKERQEAGLQAIRPLAERIESLFTEAERSILSEYLERLIDGLSE